MILRISWGLPTTGSDVDGHGSIRLTEQARPVLRGDDPMQLRKISESVGQRSKTRRSRRSTIDIAEKDEPLWAALKRLRKELSDLAGVPAYVVFSDATLADMIDRRPATTDEMSSVSGVGDHKLKQYGDDFLDVIREHSA